MLRRYRHRRGPYALAAPSVWPLAIRRIVVGVIVLFVVWESGSLAWRWITGGGGVQAKAQLTIEDGGTVNVSLENGLMQRAEGAMKLQEGDRVSTGAAGHALLTFFDGTKIRLDERTELAVSRSRQASKGGSMGITLTQGGVWIIAPAAQASSSYMREIVTPAFTATVPDAVEAIVRERIVAVLSADSQDVTVTTKSPSDTITIGEGQQLTLPPKVTDKLSRYRAAMDPSLQLSAFVTQSHALSVTSGSGSALSTGSTPAGTVISLIAPPEGATITSATMVVQGKISPKVSAVRVNGYLATIDAAQHTFLEELALRNGPTMDILVEALDDKGIVLDELTRTVKVVKAVGEGPVIQVPAGNNQVYRTNKPQVVISGTVPAHTKSVMVNDYTLQLFKPDTLTWSYLASTVLQSMQSGSNVYTVIATDDNGTKGFPATLTVMLEKGPEGVVGGTSSSKGSAASAAASSVSSVSETSLPQNAPLNPGSLSVTGPTPGTHHTATGSEFVLVGNTPPHTDSMWINGYRLQLFKPGKTFWNYIAKVEYKTLKVGTNTYHIHARNAKSELIDSVDYTVDYNP